MQATPGMPRWCSCNAPRRWSWRRCFPACWPGASRIGSAPLPKPSVSIGSGSTPAEGFQRVFSGRSAVPTLVAVIKFILMFSLTYSVIQDVMRDPVFTTSVSLPRYVEFLAQSALKICLRVLLAVGSSPPPTTATSSGGTIGTS